jgi:serine/threonine protein kinase
MDAPRTIGKYEILSTLGRGGMGVVYRARDVFIGRDVAIKQLSDNSEALRRRFLGEARSGTLNHPNLVTIYDVGEQDGCPYLVMELLSGQPLDQLLKRGQLTIPQKLDILRQVCAGLGYAHAHGIVHRDVKPGNIMVAPDLHAKVLDFGIAELRDLSSITRTGDVIGTPQYLAPERFNGLPSDGRADVWSCGVILYEMLTGQLPFSGEAMAVILKVVNEVPAPLSRYIEEVPAELNDAVDHALAKNPEERSTADQLGAELAHLLTLPSVLRLCGPTVAAEPAAPARPEEQPASSRSFTDMLRTLDSEHKADAPLVPDSGAGASTMLMPIAAPTAILRQDAQATTWQPPAPVANQAPGGAGSFTQIFNAASARASSSSHTRPQVLLTFAAAPDVMQAGKSVPVTELPFFIGRDPQCQLSVQGDLSLSKQHCSIDWRDGAYYIQDHGSRNGTWVNGRSIGADPKLLHFGSIIRCSDKTAVSFIPVDLSDLPDLSGTLIGGRYILEAPVRLSKKSAIYRGKHHRLPRYVAVKLLSPYLAIYPGYAEQFELEAEIAAGLEHPNIARIVDFGASTLSIANSPELEVQYIATDFMEGGSLGTRVAESGFLTFGETCAWLTPIADALSYAHGQEVIHGGFKATSVVFDKNFTPYLCDFAVGAQASARKSNIYFGTPDYMAPEQWDETVAPTPLTDQYSLAVAAYFSLCGVLPYEGQADPRVRTRNFERGTTNIQVESRRSGNETVPERLHAVFVRAFAVKPEDRFPSVLEFSKAFSTADVVVPITPRKPHAFFSYRRGEASGWATHFADKLQHNSIDVYLDVKRRDNATQFPSWIEDMIKRCDVFVCFLEKSTLDSSWVRQEVQLAYKNNKPMIPIIFEDFNVSDYATESDPAVQRLLTYSGVTLLNSRNVYTEAAIEDLATMIKGSPGRLN